MVITFLPLIAILAFIFIAGPQEWLLTNIIGLALLLPSLALLTLARIQLGNSFSVSPRATTLVTHGLYSRIRNPIYVFGLLLIAGLILYLDHPRLLLILLPVIPLQIIRARRESQVLQAHFGDAYRQYKSNTWF